MEEASNHIALLKEWRARLFNISKRNPLLYPENRSFLTLLKDVSANPQHGELEPCIEKLETHQFIPLITGSNEQDIQINELFAVAKKQLKERGYNYLSLSFLSLNWQLDGEELQSPLYLLPVELQKDPAFRLETASADAMVNPVVDSILQQKYGLQLPESLPVDLTNLKQTIEDISLLLTNTSFTIQTQPIYLGLFDYPGKSLVEDYNMLISEGNISPLIKDILDSNPRESTINASHNVLFDELPVAQFDPDQELAIGLAMEGKNLIIAGPPGTGKSQTITNIISSALAKNKRVLVVSAKRAALESVYGKMKSLDLHAFCALVHHIEKDKASFIEDLKGILSEKLGRPLKIDRIEAQRKTALQQYNQAYQAIEKSQLLMQSLVSGASYMTIQDLIEELLKAKDFSGQPNRELPSIGLYEDHHADFTKIYEELILKLGINQVNEHPITDLHRSAWHRFPSAQALISNIQNEWNWWEKLVRLLKELNLTDAIQSLDELQEFSKDFQAYTIFAHDPLIHYIQKNSESYQNYIKDFEELEKQGEALDKIQQFNTHWRQKLSKEEVIKLQEKLNGGKERTIKILDPNYREALFKVWQGSHLKFYERPSASALLNKLLEEYNLEESSNALKQELLSKSHGLELNKLKTLLVQWHDNQHTELKARFLPILTANKQEQLQAFFSFIQSDQSKGKLLHTREVKEGLIHLAAIQASAEVIEKCFNSFQLIANNEEAFAFALTIDKRYMLNVNQLLLNTWNEAIKTQPWLVEHSGEKYTNSRERMIQAKEEVLRLNASLLKVKQDESFHEILRAAQLSTSGLNEEDKQVYSELRAGLKILEKETSKSRAFQSFRSWQKGPEQQFIQHVKPIWMMSPDSVSAALALQKESFDIVVFDEASQLSLAACLPAIYRAKQCIVVGDERQLPPSQFFEKSIENEEEFKDDGLLAAAHKSFTAIELNWHYRSRDEALIRFNNEVFYDNKLKTIPSKETNDSVSSILVVRDTNQAAFNYRIIRENALGLHYLDQGRYVDGVNELEARYIAELTKHFLLSQQALNLGILCLSNSQQECIQAALKDLKFFDKNYEQLLQEKYANDESFDGIFIRNLENVQGEERDIILVSLGYGPNENGQLHLNFGPINQEGGDRRLNVLFSRARKHMAVISSFRSEAIQSENAGALCLKNYLSFLENHQNQQTLLSKEVQSTSCPNWIKEIGQFIESKGYEINYNYGYSSLQFALAVRGKEEDEQFMLGILHEDTSKANNTNTEVFKKAVLEAFGWQVLVLRSVDYLIDKNSVLNQVLVAIKNIEQNNQVEVPSEERKNHLDELKYDESKLLFIRLEKNENEHLFWELAGNLNDIIIRYGKVGAKGRKLIKTYDSVAQVIKEKRKLIKQKEKQGYRRV